MIKIVGSKRQMMRIQDTLEDLSRRADERSSRTHERFGQAWMNLLRIEQPHFYEMLTGTSLDPFYSSAKVSSAETRLALWLVDTMVAEPTEPS